MAKMLSMTPDVGIAIQGKALQKRCEELCATLVEITGGRAAYVIEGEGRTRHAHVLIENVAVGDSDWKTGMKYLSKENRPTVVGPKMLISPCT